FGGRLRRSLFDRETTSVSQFVKGADSAKCRASRIKFDHLTIPLPYGSVNRHARPCRRRKPSSEAVAGLTVLSYKSSMADEHTLPTAGFPQTRLRRLRYHPLIRELVRETRLDPANFVLPLF